MIVLVDAPKALASLLQFEKDEEKETEILSSIRLDIQSLRLQISKLNTELAQNLHEESNALLKIESIRKKRQAALESINLQSDTGMDNTLPLSRTPDNVGGSERNSLLTSVLAACDKLDQAETLSVGDTVDDSSFANLKGTFGTRIQSENSTKTDLDQSPSSNMSPNISGQFVPNHHSTECDISINSTFDGSKSLFSENIDVNVQDKGKRSILTLEATGVEDTFLTAYDSTENSLQDPTATVNSSVSNDDIGNAVSTISSEISKHGSNIFTHTSDSIEASTEPENVASNSSYKPTSFNPVNDSTPRMSEVSHTNQEEDDLPGPISFSSQTSESRVIQSTVAQDVSANLSSTDQTFYSCNNTVEIVIDELPILQPNTSHDMDELFPESAQISAAQKTPLFGTNICAGCGLNLSFFKSPYCPACTIIAVSSQSSYNSFTSSQSSYNPFLSTSSNSNCSTSTRFRNRKLSSFSSKQASSHHGNASMGGWDESVFAPRLVLFWHELSLLPVELASYPDPVNSQPIKIHNREFALVAEPHPRLVKRSYFEGIQEFQMNYRSAVNGVELSLEKERCKTFVRSIGVDHLKVTLLGVEFILLPFAPKNMKPCIIQIDSNRGCLYRINADILKWLSHRNLTQQLLPSSPVGKVNVQGM